MFVVQRLEWNNFYKTFLWIDFFETDNYADALAQANVAKLSNSDRLYYIQEDLSYNVRILCVSSVIECYENKINDITVE